jgi:Mo-dependent nitrogenase C-terminus
MNRIKSFVQSLFSPLFSALKIKAEQDSHIAQQIAHAIPAQCPFARTVHLPFGKQVCIPPLCELNPLYELFTELRFNALSALVDKHHLDITSFI